MRKGEIVHIKWNDIDFANSIIFIANTKNGEKKKIPVNDYLTETLKNIKRQDASTYIFCDKDGILITTSESSLQQSYKRQRLRIFVSMT